MRGACARARRREDCGGKFMSPHPPLPGRKKRKLRHPLPVCVKKLLGRPGEPSSTIKNLTADEEWLAVLSSSPNFCEVGMPTKESRQESANRLSKQKSSLMIILHKQ